MRFVNPPPFIPLEIQPEQAQGMEQGSIWPYSDTGMSNSEDG